MFSFEEQILHLIRSPPNEGGGESATREGKLGKGKAELDLVLPRNIPVAKTLTTTFPRDPRRIYPPKPSVLDSTAYAYYIRLRGSVRESKLSATHCHFLCPFLHTSLLAIDGPAGKGVRGLR